MPYYVLNNGYLNILNSFLNNTPTHFLYTNVISYALLLIFDGFFLFKFNFFELFNNFGSSFDKILIKFTTYFNFFSELGLNLFKTYASIYYQTLLSLLTYFLNQFFELKKIIFLSFETIANC